MDEGLRIELNQRERIPLMSEQDWIELMDRYFAGRLEGFEIWEAPQEND